MTTEAGDGGGVVPEVRRDPNAVEEIFEQLCNWGARLYDFDFYSRHIPPLQEYYGHGPVWDALRRYETEVLRELLTTFAAYE